MADVLQTLRGRLERRNLENRWYGSARVFMAQFVASVGPGDVLVDLGCGEGKLREQLSATVHYVDLDLATIERSNKYAKLKNSYGYRCLYRKPTRAPG